MKAVLVCIKDNFDVIMGTYYELYHAEYELAHLTL